jgi:hypothetical protein
MRKSAFFVVVTTSSLLPRRYYLELSLAALLTGRDGHLSFVQNASQSPGVSGAVSGKLASAREQLRFLLRGPGRRRFRKSSPRFPPSP